MTGDHQQSNPANPKRSRGAASCLVIAALILVQSLWVSFHLASETHLWMDGTSGYGAVLRSTASDHATAVADASTADAHQVLGAEALSAETLGSASANVERIAEKQPHEPHCALDHKVDQDNRTSATHLPTPSVHWIPTTNPCVVATDSRGVRTGTPPTGPPLPEAIDVAAACPRAPPLA